VAELKPAYLICGDDDAKIDAWRARVRRRAEEERGPGGLEAFDARASEPAEIVAALSALTFDPGTRYVLVDDVGAWKAPQLEPLVSILAEMPPETVLVAIARGKALKQLCKAVEGAGGEVREYPAPKPWELPKWLVERGRELGVQVDPEAAKELVSLVGTSQQRLSRELEKLALAVHPRTNVATADVESLARPTTSPMRSSPATSRRRWRWPSSSSRTASARGASCIRLSAACGRCTGPPRCSTGVCPSRRWARR
jgi:DNA polymerase III delta subunit